MRDQTNEVDRFLRDLDHPLKEEIVAVRDINLGADNEITEHIRWNAPSFCYQGQDRVTFKLHSQDGIHLIFHRGAKVKGTQRTLISRTAAGS